LNTVAFIFARGGSKELPNKNILMLEGKPLIAWAVEHAKAVESINEVIVSTDSLEIASLAKECGAEVPFIRPSELATDDSPEWLSWQHGLIDYRERMGKLPDCFVSVPTTSPLRLPEDIERCIELFRKGNADVVVSITESRRSPYFNIVKESDSGILDLVSKPIKRISRRQDSPKTYDLTTVCYVANPNFILHADSIFEGKVSGIKVPHKRAIDIDSIYDFQLCRLILAEKRETWE
jgi:N-acylneuraminate cytidylyltransferase